MIVCYKLNGQWLDSERGGPVRMVVPEAYGFKSVKWLSHVVLTNLAHANDTYAEADNDIDSPIKYMDGWTRVPDQGVYDNAFKVEWELFLKHVVTGSPFPWTLFEGAKGVQLAELGLKSWAERRWVDVPPLK